MADISSRPPRRHIAQERRNSPLAFAALIIVCLGLLYIVFAPKGSLVTEPTPTVTAEGAGGQ